MNGKARQRQSYPEKDHLDPVELAGLVSFPASDPPSLIAVHLGCPARLPTQGFREESVSRKADASSGARPDRDSTEKQFAPDPPMADRVRPRPSR